MSVDPLTRTREQAPSALVEREEPLAALQAHLTDAGANGRLVLLRGEAGIGKTSLMQAFIASAPESVTVHVGVCDGVSTPRPFSPLYELVDALGRELGTLLTSAAPRQQVSEWMLRRLSQEPMLLAIEDVHWADEATLDLLVYLGRRLHTTHTLLVATVREGEPDAAGAAFGLLGSLATMSGVHSLPLSPLSRAAVQILAAGSDLNPAELHRLSGGNPFFVVELLASGDPTVPVTVGDVIRGRLARLDDRARYALDAAAVIGTRVEPWLLSAIAGEKVIGIDDCLRAGLIRKNDGGLSFRHELTRLEVIEGLPVIRGIGLHRRALDALERSGSTDLARLAYHAEGAADAAGVLRHAREAAEVALRTGAYAEAIAQLERARRFADGLPDAEHATLLERLSYAVFLVNRQQEAYDLRRKALVLRQRVGDPLAEGDEQRWLSRLAWIRGRGEEAWERGWTALRILEPLGETHELRMAISNLAHMYMIEQQIDDALEWGQRALVLARRAQDHEVVAHALNNVGSTLLNTGDPRGNEMLRESAAIAREQRMPEHLDRALYNIAGGAFGQRDLATAEVATRELIEWTSRTELERCSLEASLAMIHVEQGRWVEAEALARTSVAMERTDPPDRCQALVALSVVAMRRGDPTDAYLTEAAELARGLNALGWWWPVAAARAEHAWLHGDLGSAIGELREVYDLAQLRRDGWAMGDLGRWLWRAGALDGLPEHAALPYRLEVRGESAAAAAEWDRLGVPYEAAMSLAGSADPAALREAHARLLRLGATATAHIVAQRLRAIGEPAPRGPRASTRANPSQLTEREREVAILVAEGLSNAEIAARLVLSQKTVGHHVSAVLAKLDVRRRGEVAGALASGQAAER